MCKKRVGFVTCVNNHDVYTHNVIASTKSYSDEIEYIVIENPPCASVGLNEGIRKISEDIIVCCHQDIFFLGDNWIDKMFEQLNRIPKWGVCGCAGTLVGGDLVGCCGGLGMGKIPITVQTLDCSLLILDRHNKLFFDENLQYFHMYGEDIALQANEKGLGAYVIYAPIIHNSKHTSRSGFKESYEYMRQKWRSKVETIYTTVGQY